MSKILKKFFITILAIILPILNVYAMPYDSSDYTSVDELSELLPKDIREDVAIEPSVRRGDFFAQAELIITDEGDGNIGALAIAYLDHSVDEVYITIYLDQWNEETEKWQQVAYYDAEFYEKDYPDGLTNPDVNITFLDQERDHYYRLRSVFSAIDGDDYEGFSPTTAGIWID